MPLRQQSLVEFSMAGVILDKDKRVSSLVGALRLARDYVAAAEDATSRQLVRMLDEALAGVEHDPNAGKPKRGSS